MKMVFEKGGGMTNSFAAQIVVDETYKPIRPLMIFTRGDLACNRHAGFAAIPGRIILAAWKDGRLSPIELLIARYMGDGQWEDILVHSFHNWEEWNEFVAGADTPLQKALGALAAKSRCYHCRCVHYATTDAIPKRRWDSEYLSWEVRHPADRW